MFQKLISIILAFAIAFIGIVEPANATPDYLQGRANSTVEQHGNNNSSRYDRSFNHYDNYYESKDSDGALKNGVEFVVGVVATCYTLDFAVSLFFPPAIAGAAVCGYAPGLAASGAAAAAAAAAL